ncbi:hypothetical protein SKAU_G00203420 [Synaphobranchus kaupii]|uniref:Uncharacterized protein n=1 Tax=Synaphobranchus kaupii TaxID=118154 RepID=A0A9Q1IYF4_SYNKA|nr:hypothetical protein SKAU_G00203420 [Synaphobranchus kaupii]
MGKGQGMCFDCGEMDLSIFQRWTGLLIPGEHSCDELVLQAVKSMFVLLRWRLTAGNDAGNAARGGGYSPCEWGRDRGKDPRLFANRGEKALRQEFEPRDNLCRAAAKANGFVRPGIDTCSPAAGSRVRENGNGGGGGGVRAEVLGPKRNPLSQNNNEINPGRQAALNTPPPHHSPATCESRTARFLGEWHGLGELPKVRTDGWSEWRASPPGLVGFEPNLKAQRLDDTFLSLRIACVSATTRESAARGGCQSSLGPGSNMA